MAITRLVPVWQTGPSCVWVVHVWQVVRSQGSVCVDPRTLAGESRVLSAGSNSVPQQRLGRPGPPKPSPLQGWRSVFQFAVVAITLVASGATRTLPAPCRATEDVVVPRDHRAENRRADVRSLGAQGLGAHEEDVRSGIVCRLHPHAVKILGFVRE